MKQINILRNVLYILKNVDLNLLRAYYLVVGGKQGYDNFSWSQTGFF